MDESELYPPKHVTVKIFLDGDGDFTVKPTKCLVDSEGTVSFETDKTTAAMVFIPDTMLVFKEGGQKPGSSVEFLTTDGSETLNVADFPAVLPYSVFQIEQGKVVGGINRAPVIIIVHAATR